MDRVWLCYLYDPNDASGRESVVAVAATEELAKQWLKKCWVEIPWRSDFSVPAIRRMSLCASRVDNMYPFNQPHVDSL